MKQLARYVNTKFVCPLRGGEEGVSEVSGQIPLSVTKWIFGRPLISTCKINTFQFDLLLPGLSKCAGHSQLALTHNLLFRTS